MHVSSILFWLKSGGTAMINSRADWPELRHFVKSLNISTSCEFVTPNLRQTRRLAKFRVYRNQPPISCGLVQDRWLWDRLAQTILNDFGVNAIRTWSSFNFLRSQSNWALFGARQQWILGTVVIVQVPVSSGTTSLSAIDFPASEYSTSEKSFVKAWEKSSEYWNTCVIWGKEV